VRYVNMVEVQGGVIVVNWAHRVYYDPPTVLYHNVEGRVIERPQGNKKTAALVRESFLKRTFRDLQSTDGVLNTLKYPIVHVE
jgi:hypothetical protein